MDKERTVAVHGVHVDVCRVCLGAEAVVVVVHPHSLHSETVDVEGVEEITILGQRRNILMVAVVNPKFKTGDMTKCYFHRTWTKVTELTFDTAETMTSL